MSDESRSVSRITTAVDEVDRSLSVLVNAYGGTGSSAEVPPAEQEFTRALERLFCLVTAGLEAVAARERAARVTEEWNLLRKTPGTAYVVERTPGGSRVRSAAVDLLRSAATALCELEARREEARLVEDRRRTDDRRSALWLAGLSGLVTVGVAVAGQLGHLQFSGDAKPGVTALVVGPLLVTDNAAPAMVTCLPKTEHVLVANGASEYTVTVLPEAPRPLRLYCMASNGAGISPAVAIDVSAGAGGRIGGPPINLLPGP